MNFCDEFTRTMRGEPQGLPNTSRQTPEYDFVFVNPTPVSKPNVIAWSQSAAELLGISENYVFENGCNVTELFSGNKLAPGITPWASCYGGHQFGHWAGQLGDGRAISLGTAWHHNQMVEIQLKGAGPTPYSRRADGRAVLRSSLREFVCSEVMHFLGVPTTRALCCLTTGEGVVRDMFYDGNPVTEPGAITTRLAPSFLRFGHYEVLAWRNKPDQLRKLLDYTIEHFYPELNGETHRYETWFARLMTKSIAMVAHWQRVGFVHGVMNTDNMSALGLTIDYGPYGWMDIFDPGWTPNTTDAEYKRYCFGNQPRIVGWNLMKLAESIAPVCAHPEMLTASLEQYHLELQNQLNKVMLEKLGLGPSPGSTWLMENFNSALCSVPVDMTIFFRQLAELQLPRTQLTDIQILAVVEPALYSSQNSKKTLIEWCHQFVRQHCAAREPQSNPVITKQKMNAVNPFIIPRNFLVQEIIEDTSQISDFMTAFQHPYDDLPVTRKYFKPRPEWAANKPGCATLSCSS